MTNSCIIFVGNREGAASLGKCVRDVFSSPEPSEISLFIFSDASVADVIPALRDFLLNNVLHGVRIYLVRSEDVGKVLSELKRAVEGGTVRVCLQRGSDLPKEVEDLFKECGAEVEVVVL